MKKINKPAVDRKRHLRKTDKLTVAPRQEGVVKNARMYSKKKPKK